jgi:phosphate transport system protein
MSTPSPREPVPAEPMRHTFREEMDQLRMQVELMGVRVDENLERMRENLRTGDLVLAQNAFEADNEIDAMNVSLTERCYLLLTREAPVASDLRFIVSVLRIISELERVGDLALRVVKLSPKHDLLRSSEVLYDILVTVADEAVECFRVALRAWSSQDLELATQLATQHRDLDLYYERLLGELKRLEGPDAVRIAMAAFTAGRALERIADHSAIIGARLRYLITGEPAHLAAEVR